jgi:hypothetical protein
MLQRCWWLIHSFHTSRIAKPFKPGLVVAIYLALPFPPTRKGEVFDKLALFLRHQEIAEARRAGILKL